MKNFIRIFATLALAVTAFGQQNTLTRTTTSSSMTASQTTIVLGSITNVAVTSGSSNGAILYVLDPGQQQGEVMFVTSVGSSASTPVGVRRGMNGTKAVAHVSGAVVYLGQPQWFYSSDPQGSCVTASTYVTPYINVANGNQWLCSTISLSWVPGFINKSAPAAVTAAVASAAGSIVPSGPLFHVTGTSAVTGFTVASMLGFANSGCFTTIPDAIWTWTSAGNVAVAGTAVVNRALTFCWDNTNSKWVPSYV